MHPISLWKSISVNSEVFLAQTSFGQGPSSAGEPCVQTQRQLSDFMNQGDSDNMCTATIGSHFQGECFVGNVEQLLDGC
jgi:hypothetical protein